MAQLGQQSQRVERQGVVEQSMRKSKPGTPRTRQLAAIHVIAQKQLCLDRETYVGLLQRVGGVSSTSAAARVC